MRISIVGGGPAGLYLALLVKQRHPDFAIRVFEQNPEGATWGFGVVFSERALEFLRDDDPSTYDLIQPRMQTWRDITLVHRGVRVRLDGIGFSGIGRLELIALLTARARAVGITPEFSHTIRSLDELPPSDLVVGADGVNSLVRRAYEGDFASSLSYLENKFAWYGTRQPFDSLTLTFVETPDGQFTAHHYRYSPEMSTFIVECDRATWLRVGFADMSEAESRAYCERAFHDTLGGQPLVANHSLWRTFPVLTNRRYAYRNLALVGDALHTAHFTIGSGTRLALEDVIALAKAIDAHPQDVPAALAHYQATRQPILEKLLTAAHASAMWHESFPTHMQLAPRDFAMSYVTRSGRISDERLRAMAPDFMRWYEAT